jgi:Domain of unknown function (DUF1707)/Domain of unknown function (DUF4190)
VADNESQWWGEYPRYSPPGGRQDPTVGQTVPPGGYHVVPPPPAGYPVPPPPYPVPHGYPHQVAGFHGQAPMNANMRAASADRERAVDVLKAGFAEGRLTQEEYTDRMGRAYAARTYGELAVLTADLPAGPWPAAWPMPQPQPATTNSMAIASMVLGVAEFFTLGLTGVPAVICGHMARRQMKLTGQRGDGLATGGLVLGYMAIIFWSVLLVGIMVGAAISITRTGGQSPG